MAKFNLVRMYVIGSQVLVLFVYLESPSILDVLSIAKYQNSFIFDGIHGPAAFFCEGPHTIKKFPGGVRHGIFFNLFALIFNKSLFIFPNHTPNFGTLYSINYFLHRISNGPWI